MSRYKLDRLLCIDTEWTCWDGPAPDGMSPEIIEVGVVECDVATLGILREGRFLVRPSRSTVSPFCTGLTGLTQREVTRQGRALGEVLGTISKTFGPARKITLAWGDDRAGIDDECRAAGLANPFPAEHFHDIGKSYALLAGTANRPGLSAALGRLGLGFEGTPHRALDDARNTVRAYAAMARATREAFPDPDAAPDGPSPR